jgi:hypothetical protein
MAYRSSYFMWIVACAVLIGLLVLPTFLFWNKGSSDQKEIEASNSPTQTPLPLPNSNVTVTPSISPAMMFPAPSPSPLASLPQREEPVAGGGGPKPNKPQIKSQRKTRLNSKPRVNQDPDCVLFGRNCI